MVGTSYLYIFVKSGPILRHFDFFELNRYFAFGMSSIIDKWAQKNTSHLLLLVQHQPKSDMTASAARQRLRPPPPASPAFPTRRARAPHRAVASSLCALRSPS